MNIEEAVAKSAETLTIFIVKEALFCNYTLGQRVQLESIEMIVNIY